MSQRYAPLIAGLGSSSRLVEITPSDDTDLDEPVRALWVGTTGDVELIAEDDPNDGVVVIKNVPDGTLLPIRVRRVLASNTDAQDIIGLM